MTQTGSGLAHSHGKPTPIFHRIRLVAGTLVLTLEGALPVEFLSPGDRIITRDGARSLSALSAAPLDRADMVHIPASTLGHGRPDDGLMLPPDQKLLIRDWRAKALFGHPRVIVAAARLIDGQMIRRETVTALRLFTLAFAAPVVIYAGGLEPATSPQRHRVPA
ncbi:Hint domain-containing protein [Paracoccaceae bacterium Fryx2]|nr:Hint domain-containing protein [Paracoccaceae bacterium Fryx2]